MRQRTQMKDGTATLVGRRLPPSRRPGVLARQVGVLTSKDTKTRLEMKGRSLVAVGRRLLPSRLVALATDIQPRRQRGQASSAVGFPRESSREAVLFQAARQEPSPYQLSVLRVPSCSSWMDLFPAPAPAEPPVYRIPTTQGPKLRRSGPNGSLLRSLGFVGGAGHSINRTALRASSRSSRIKHRLAGRGRPAHGPDTFLTSP